jgi:actin-like ATPase involved in cell morphogenesis
MYTLGIDLGTTFTAVAVARPNGDIRIADLGNHSAAIPSLVFLREDGTVLVGDAALRRGVTEPHRLAREFKRRVGDVVPIMLANTPYSAERLMGHLLTHVVTGIAEREGEIASAVAISHPANWGPFKIDLLRQAVNATGLTNATFVTEPVAAAIKYASTERVERGAVVAVYDLGGGTFDAAVLRKTADGFETMGEPHGIERLGGIDFDEAVFRHVLDAIGGIDHLDLGDPSTRAALAHVRSECVAAKEALSSDADATVSVLLPGVNTQIRITRPEFEDMVRPALRETMEALQRAIKAAHVSGSEVDVVLLAGGSSRIPLISEMVRAEFARPVALDSHPKLAVALGAARLAAGLGVAEDTPAAAAAAPTATAPAVPPAPAPSVAPAPAASRPTMAPPAAAPPAPPVASPSAPVTAAARAERPAGDATPTAPAPAPAITPPAASPAAPGAPQPQPSSFAAAGAPPASAPTTVYALMQARSLARQQAESEAVATPPSKRPSRRNRLPVIIGIAAALLIGIGGTAAFALGRGSDSSAAEDTSPTTETPVTDGETTVPPSTSGQPPVTITIPIPIPSPPDSTAAPTTPAPTPPPPTRPPTTKPRHTTTTEHRVCKSKSGRCVDFVKVTQNHEQLIIRFRTINFDPHKDLRVRLELEDEHHEISTLDSNPGDDRFVAHLSEFDPPYVKACLSVLEGHNDVEPHTKVCRPIPRTDPTGDTTTTLAIGDESTSTEP